ncbi:hypothetical protein J6590_029257 [Homalodisca vitripennis]|nr:hypothetical protein J6590_029257 [Homalodisca vitripennis]
MNNSVRSQSSIGKDNNTGAHCWDRTGAASHDNNALEDVNKASTSTGDTDVLYKWCDTTMLLTDRLMGAVSRVAGPLVSSVGTRMRSCGKMLAANVHGSRQNGTVQHVRAVTAASGLSVSCSMARSPLPSHPSSAGHHSVSRWTCPAAAAPHVDWATRSSHQATGQTTD